MWGRREKYNSEQKLKRFQAYKNLFQNLKKEFTCKTHKVKEYHSKKRKERFITIIEKK